MMTYYIEDFPSSTQILVIVHHKKKKKLALLRFCQLRYGKVRCITDAIADNLNLATTRQGYIRCNTSEFDVDVGIRSVLGDFAKSLGYIRCDNVDWVQHPIVI